MSRADYLGKQFFKIAQLTNSSICYKNTFLSPRVVAGYSQQFCCSCQIWNCLSQVATKTWAALRPSSPCRLEEQGISIRRSMGTCDRDAEGEIWTEKTTWYYTLNALPEPSFFNLPDSKQAQRMPIPMGAQERLQPQHEGWDFIEVFQSLPLQVNPNFNRKTIQTPGDACAHSSPATASKQ